MGKKEGEERPQKRDGQLALKDVAVREEDDVEGKKDERGSIAAVSDNTGNEADTGGQPGHLETENQQSGPTLLMRPSPPEQNTKDDETTRMKLQQPTSLKPFAIISPIPIKVLPKEGHHHISKSPNPNQDQKDSTIKRSQSPVSNIKELVKIRSHSPSPSPTPRQQELFELDPCVVPPCLEVDNRNVTFQIDADGFQMQKCPNRRANSVRQRRRRYSLKDNGHKSFTAHQDLRDVLVDILGLRFVAHEEHFHKNNETYNPDLILQWTCNPNSPLITVYCEVKCARIGSFTQVVNQCNKGRKFVNNVLGVTKDVLFLGFIWRSGNMELAICQGDRAWDFYKIVLAMNSWRIKPHQLCTILE